jgi:hypothetical protein
MKLPDSGLLKGSAEEEQIKFSLGRTVPALWSLTGRFRFNDKPTQVPKPAAKGTKLWLKSKGAPKFFIISFLSGSGTTCQNFWSEKHRVPWGSGRIHGLQTLPGH